jgi:hypothetical protein
VKIPLKQYWALLSQYLRPQWPRVLLLTFVLLAHIGLRLVNLLYRTLFDRAGI